MKLYVQLTFFVREICEPAMIKWQVGPFYCAPVSRDDSYHLMMIFPSHKMSSIFTIDSKGFLRTPQLNRSLDHFDTSPYYKRTWPPTRWFGYRDTLCIRCKLTGEELFALISTHYAHWSDSTAHDASIDTTTYSTLIHVLSTLNEHLEFTDP